MKKLFVFLSFPVILLLLDGIGHAARAGGGQPPLLQVLDGSLGQLSKDSFNIVADTFFFSASYDTTKLPRHYPVRNTVKLRIDPYSPYYLKRSFSATLRLELAITGADGSVTTLDTSLTVRYNKDSLIRDQDSYLFSGGYRVKVTVIDRQTDADWDIWRSLTLENELTTFPAFVFNSSSDTILSVSHAALDSGTTSDELTVSWTNVISADQYDLEWTYVDSSALKSSRQPYGNPSSPNAALIFENGASRVTIAGTTYNIPIFYDGAGTVFFRVRPVQLLADGSRIEGQWSSDRQAPGSFYFKGHQRNLNWQSTASYAEEGKRKVVVQYYDGGLRGRQTVTKDNTTNTTVVAESYYDYQGRPVIQVLPAPTFSNVIQYSKNFNLGLNGAYDKNDFDSLSDPSQYFNSSAAAMDTAKGAAQYYSPANPDHDTGIAKYIPDAGGYPFTEVEYVQDNTGRISRQSGVGPRHRLGSGHETKYFYGTPDQHELDALFGTEVGDNSHYFKTMVEDANGQFSVSYTDMHGRTIATALAGAPDSTKLDTLSTYDSVRVTESLTNPAANVIHDLVMESKKGLIVAMRGTHQFTYKLNPASLQMPDCHDSAVCYDCLYDLEISITGDYNNHNLGGKAFDTVFHNFSPGGRPDTTCSRVADSFSVSWPMFLEAGSYEITKRLSVSRWGEIYYRDSVFMRRNSCKNANTFLLEQKAIQASVTECAPSCDSCKAQLGDWPTFYQRFITQAGIASGDSSYKDMILSSYQQAQAACRLLCDSVNDLDNIRQAMLLDMTPPSGQYATVDSLSDPYSIFYVPINSAGEAIDSAVYTRCNNNYIDENGRPDSVYDEEAGRMVAPQDLSQEAFAQKFKLSWAEALLPYHPEYCKLQQYEKLATSVAWDKRFEATDTYAEALSKGYLNPTQGSGSLFTRFNATGTADYDPITGVSGYKTALEDSLQSYINNTSPPAFTITMWGFATATIRCAGRDTACIRQYQKRANDDSAFNSNMCSGDLDMTWRTFRQMYLDVKHKLINARLKDSCGASAGALLTAGHQPHFTDAGEIVQAADITPPSDPNAAVAQNQATIDNYYDSTCLAYVTSWWQTLQSCYNSTDSAFIIPRLLQVCKEGSDGSHPYGASSVKPSSAYQYRSFEDVLEQYNATKGYSTTTCNAYGIKAPKPYDQQLAYNSKPLWTRPDSCECDHIQSLYNSYQAVAGHYLSFSDYMYKAYQTAIPDSVLTQLRNMCSLDPAGGGCVYLAKPIQLPPALQCSTGDICVGCTQFQSLDAEFRGKYPGLTPVMAPSATDSVQLGINQLYEQFMNYRLGFTKTTAEYLAFLSGCNGINETPAAPATYDTATVSCPGLDSLIHEYKRIYLQPVLGYADIDMRTFAGNITPAEGPKGVFNVNGILIGNTIDGTVSQVNSSFAQLWNSDTADQRIGTLAALDNGQFHLQLEPGQVVPPDGIIGMRYYQFDIPYDTLDAVLTGLGSYIDLGDGQHIKVDSNYTSAATQTGEIYLANNSHYQTYFYVSHTYSSAQNRTVTVYHTDINGVVGFDNYLDATHAVRLPGLKNLRGYAPENLGGLIFHSTQDSSLNTLDGFVNKSKLWGLWAVNMHSGDGTTPFKNYNFGSLAQFHTLKDVRLDQNDLYHPRIDSILPDIPVNFPLLRILIMPGQLFSDAVDLTLSYFEGGYIPNLTTAQVDRLLNQVAFSTMKDTGGINLTGQPRSSASDSAVARLTAKHWTIITATDNINPDAWTTVARDTVELKNFYPASSNFDDFINSKLGTSMSWYEVNSFFKRKCGTLPDLTTPDTLSTMIPPKDSCRNYQFIGTYTGPNTSDLVQTGDGGYLSAGNETGTTGGSYGSIIKTGQTGNLVWKQTYVGSNAVTLARVKNTSDGGFVAVGSTNSFSQAQGEPLIIKANPSGSTQWIRTLGAGSTHGEAGVDVIQTSDGGYAIAANYNNSPATVDWEVIRLDSNGNTIWSKTIATPSSDNVGGLIEDQDTLVLSGLFISAELGKPDTKYDGILMKINKSNGNVIWSKSYDFDSRCNWFFDINKTTNGYIINSVMTDDFDPDDPGNIQPVVVELDKNGDTLRIRKIPSPPGAQTGAATVFPTPDGGYISSQSEDSAISSIHIYKTGSSGNIEWGNRIKFVDDQRLARLIVNSDGTYTGGGYKSTGAGGNAIVVRVDSSGRSGCYDSTESFSNAKPIIHQYLDTLTSSSVTITNTLRTLSENSRPPAGTLICSHNSCPRIVTDTMFLCGRSGPVLPPVSLNTVTNCSDSTFFAVSKSTELYTVYTDSLRGNFDSNYHAQCMQAYKYEQFTVTHNNSEYHHTLYYYDQAGNLLKTIPPSGVQANYRSTWLDSVQDARAAGQTLLPAHSMPTQYRYNTLNQVVTQQTPDGGKSMFWYDRLGRLSISQNARQKAVSGTEAGRQYSYTLYDDIGRITEVGQLANAGSSSMTDSISRVEGNLLSWLTASAANKEQITQTVYDTAYTGFTGISFGPMVQRNLRNRVAYTTFTLGNNPAQYNQGTFYTYDIEGNVDTLLQDFGSSTLAADTNIMNLNGNRFKRMVYQYDLVSGKVNSVAYQPHQVDAFYHRYTYDAENRLTLAETSTDSAYWDKEARYEYYKHGPLARVIMGDKMIQGLDYAYTLQGWLKGVNSTSLLPVYDMGRDGDTTYQNRYIAKDVYGFGLNYYPGDYSAIGTGVNPFPGSSAYLNTNDRPLFNGNISSMAVNIGPLYRNPGGTDTSHWRGPLLYNYHYDQLNRITGMDAYYGLNQTTNSWAGLLSTADFRERVSYDGNGNIQGYKRNNFGETGLPMDSLHYNYTTGTNKLDFIRDSASDAVGGGYDLHSQPGGNYAYDSIGNLIRDSSEKISAIKWNVYGKITEISRSVTSTSRPSKNIYYYYDAAGHRIGKKVVRGDTSAVSYTWYVRDASGNVMATYTASIDSTRADSSADLQLNEQHIYGSSRLGILTTNKSVDGNTSGVNNYASPWTGVHLPYYIGRKQYELANHLGNVLATITDKKIGVSLAADSSLIDHYEAEVKTAQDYYPFGMIMPGRMYTAISIPGGSYAQTTTVNGYSLPVDLTVNSRTGTTPSTYTATHGIEFTEGFEAGINDDVTAYIADSSYAGGGNGEDDGGAIAGTGKYRYGFNGKEKDDEVKGVGDQIDYGARIYDPRVGRFMSVDPLKTSFAGQAPYAFSGNNPIFLVEVYGEGPRLPPLFAPVQFIGSVGLANPMLAWAFTKAKNTSLSHLQKAAWYSPVNSLADLRYHDVKTNFNTLYGVAGELEMMQRFLLDAAPNELLAHPIQSFVNTENLEKAISLVHQQVKFEFEPDAKTDYVITYMPNGKDKTTYHYAFDDLRENFFGNFIKPQSKIKDYTEKTEFVHEVKIVSPKNEDLLEIIETGVNQLLSNPRVQRGGVPVLVIDRKSAEKALSSDPERFNRAISLLEERGGGLATENGLNKAATEAIDAVLQTIRRETIAPPKGYYKGTKAQQQSDDKENN
ncbi:MAG TPA: RHS repeat-associated core domain-containing protein [Puia sp.]|nr:RHS repeat-associated core domain-containing protein [Puia sp.]